MKIKIAAILLVMCAGAAAAEWPGHSRGMGIGGWLTNYKRFNVLPVERRLVLTEGDYEHFDSFITETDVANIRSLGFDHVRLGFDQIVVEESPGRYRERTFRRIDEFLGWCERHSLNVVLNLHKAIGNYCDIPEKVQLLDDAGLQDRFVALWLEVERRYHGRPAVAFELLNEVRNVDPEKWNALADRTIRAIRAVNPDRWIVVGPIGWNYPRYLKDLRLWDDPKVVYTFHFYEPSEFTHQRGVLQADHLFVNRTLEYPSADVERYRACRRTAGWEANPYPDVKAIDRAFLKTCLRPAFEFAAAHPDRILWNGEFGTIRHAPAASRVAYMRDVASLCREHGIPYCVWNYLSTPNDGNRFSLVDDDTREFLSPELLKACLGQLPDPAAESDRVALDLTATTGPVKPVNGIGQPPMLGLPVKAKMFHYLKEAGIPYSRLHDVGGWQGQGRYVDIPNVFRNFDADENDPKNYDFDCTDILVKNLVENGVEPFYRLGVSIENPWEWGLRIGSNARIVPPKDFAKWARICEHVIRHYTEGWANGFRYKMTYWEIWNEPDNRENPGRSPLWQAPFEEYVRFYGVVAPYLKAKFPHLKIGGYGCCGFYDAVGASAVGAAHSSPRTRHFLECAHRFLASARDNKWPVDFFSYHSYSDAKDALKQVHYANKILNDYGFTADRTERIYNEWMPDPKHESLGTAMQAAKIAAELIGLQNGPCDMACIYDGRCGLGDYSPLFNPMTYEPHKAYYAFKAFNELRKLGTAVKPPKTPDGVYLAAATDGKDSAAVLVANISGAAWKPAFDFGAYEAVDARVVDRIRTYEVAELPAEMHTDSVWLVTLARKKDGGLTGDMK